MTLDPNDVDAIIVELMSRPLPTSEIAAQAPAMPGLYGWWASPRVLPAMPGPAHPTDAGLRLLYVGIAVKLRTRLRSNHLRRTGSSTLRRTLPDYCSMTKASGPDGRIASCSSTRTRRG